MYGHFFDGQAVDLEQLDNVSLPVGKPSERVESGATERFIALFELKNRLIVDVNVGFDALDSAFSPIKIEYSVAADRIDPWPDRFSRQIRMEKAMDRKKSIL